MRYFTFLSLAIVLAGCETTEGFLKQIESGAYNAAARSVSEYCKRTSYDIVAVERVQARREIRQRGFSGPKGAVPGVKDLDKKTQHGPGPVVRIWCEGEEVPDVVFQDFVK